MVGTPRFFHTRTVHGNRNLVSCGWVIVPSRRYSKNLISRIRVSTLFVASGWVVMDKNTAVP
jgi:hypothetical protein